MWCIYIYLYIQLLLFIPFRWRMLRGFVSSDFFQVSSTRSPKMGHLSWVEHSFVCPKAKHSVFGVSLGNDLKEGWLISMNGRFTIRMLFWHVFSWFWNVFFVVRQVFLLECMLQTRHASSKSSDTCNSLFGRWVCVGLKSTSLRVYESTTPVCWPSSGVHASGRRRLELLTMTQCNAFCNTWRITKIKSRRFWVQSKFLAKNQIKHFVPREKALFNFRANRALRLKTKRPKAPSGARSQRNEPFVFDRALLRCRSFWP